MIDLNNDYWNNKYITDDFKWDLGAISEPLKKYFLQLENKNLKILIPGAGNSYEAEFLFNLGFKNVFVLDFAKQPLINIKNRVPNFPENQLLCQDFFDHTGTYDLIIEQTFFCAINPKLRKKYVQQMRRLLNTNGKLVGLLFDDILNNDKPPFGGNKAEYELLFKPEFKIKVLDVCYNSIKPRQNRELFIIME